MSSNPTATDSISSDGKHQPPPSSKKAGKPKKVSKKAAAHSELSPPPADHPSRLSAVREQQPPAQTSRFTAHLHAPLLPGPPSYPYPSAPGYPMNGHYGSPSPFPHAPNPVNGQGHPHAHLAPQYPYPMHHYNPAYAPYPPYSAQPGMVMYSPPGPPQPEPPRVDASSPTMSASATGKRKNSADDGPSGSGQSSSAPVQSEPKKRTKTQRACDSCRSRKIRCDILPDTDPPKCQHCNQYGFECTFFLPITETRFKKKKIEEEQAAAAADKEREVERSTLSPHVEQAKNGDVKVYGPTSAAYLLHSSAMISSRTYETYDMRYHHTWDVSADVDGVIQVNEPQKGELQLSLPKPVDLRIEREVVEKLLNAYFTEIAPLLPVVKREEFLAQNPPPAVLLYSMCLIAATRRDVPQHIFDSIRYAVNSLIKAEDVLSTASIVNVQTLLILAMSGDCHSQSVPNALSALWIRLGTAIRMAQDLGLHRAEAVKQNIELRRRLWGICVISDRWISVTYGHPHMIDVQDCDARLPSSGDPHDAYIDELVRLSVILGRVQKAIYTPAGLNVTNDEVLYTILRDLETWKKNLPDDLQFRGPDTPRNAGILFMFYASVNMLFWRVFMRISYSCPAHLKFCLTVERWTDLVRMTSDAIDWLDANDRVYDSWLLIAYCATSCALVQYHTWARRRDSDAQAKLRKLRDCVRKWEASLSPDQMSARRKTAEIIALLYEATQGPQQALEPPPLNPTGGVKGKPPTGGLTFTKDPSRPGGGVFVAREKPSEELVRELPEGTIITEDNQNRSTTAASSSSMVNLTAIGSNYQNVNPALNTAVAGGGPENVQILNMLDYPQGTESVQQFHVADPGFFGSIPANMYDYSQWDSFFSRFGGPSSNLAGYQSQQQQQQQAQHPSGVAQPQASGSQQQQQQPHPQQQAAQSHQGQYSQYSGATG